MPPVSAEGVLSIIREMPLPERKRLAKLLETPPDPFKEVGYVIVPEAVGELMLETIGKTFKFVTKQGRMLVDLANRLKRRRSDPQTIRRNVEICDLRKHDARKWTQGRLGKKYHVTTRAIRKILADEEKWRKLAAKLGTD